MANLKNNYNRSGSIAEQKLATNFTMRLPNPFEFKDPKEDVTSNHLLSLVSKDFYLKTEGDKKMQSVNIQLSGSNNLWLNNCVLNF